MTVDSEPIQTRHVAPVRRVGFVTAAVIGAVAVGSVIGVVLLRPFGAGATPGGAASYVSAEAVAYVELRIEPEGDQDASLRELVARFPVTGLEGEGSLFLQLLEMVEDESIAGLSYEADVEPWFDGTVALAVHDLGMSAMPLSPMAPVADGAMPRGVALLGVDDRAAAEATMNRLFAEDEADDETYTSREHRGVTIWSLASGADGPPADGMGMSYAVTADQVLVSTTAVDVVAALDARSGDDTLAARADVARLLDKLPDEFLMLAVVDSSAMFATDADDGDDADPFAALIEGQPTLSATTVRAEADRLVIDQVSDAPSGLYATSNADRGLAEQMPSDAIAYVEAGNVGPPLAALIESFVAAMQMDVEPGSGIGPEQLLGNDPGGYVRWIGDAAGMVGWRDGEPYGGVLLVPTDADEAAERIDDLLGLARLAAMNPESGVTVTDTPIAGVTVYTVIWGPSAPASDRFEIQVSVEPERVLIGIGGDFVPRVLELGEAESLATSDRFGEMVDELGGTENAGVVWVDLAAARDAVETAMGDAFGVSDSYEADIRPWLLPLDRAAGVSRLDGDFLKSSWVITVE